MRRDSVIRSTAFRLALVFMALFLGAFLATGLTVYTLTKWQLRQRQNQAVRELFSVISASYSDGDLGDLLNTVRTSIDATRDHERVFLIIAPGGKVLASNIPAITVPPGWSTVIGAELGLERDLQYQLYSGTVGANRLTVGADLQDVDSIEDIVLSSFAWASIIVGVSAVAGGAVIAARVQRRFSAVRQTMARVSRGELGARIPLLGRGDDIDLLSQDINAALERLASTVEGMRQVSAGIAHDLKTPFNRLTLVVDDALKGYHKQETLTQTLALVSNEVTQINRTFDALLRIAQIETGARKARFEPVDIKRLLSRVTDTYQVVAEDAGQCLHFAIETEQKVVIQGDCELLTQMYVNLIENAIRHCPSGTRINVALLRTRNRSVSVVRDDGPGIPAAEHERVFRRLYRLDKSRTIPGTGLGLSLVKAVAELHDAEICLEDANPGLQVSIIFAGLHSEQA